MFVNYRTRSFAAGTFLALGALGASGTALLAATHPATAGAAFAPL